MEKKKEMSPTQGIAWLFCFIPFTVRAEISNLLPIKLHEERLRDSPFMRMVCEAVMLNANKANYIYSAAASRNDAEIAFENALRNCLCDHPIYGVELKNANPEPQRNYSTLSIFILPQKWPFETIERQLLHTLNAKQRNKDAHKYIFIWQRRHASLERLFRLFWSKGILYVVGFNATPTNTLPPPRHRQSFAYTYEPFTMHGFTLKRLSAQDNLFYDKLRNLHHHQLIISMFTDHIRAKPKPNVEREGYDAVDGYTAKMIIALLNATARYLLPTDGKTYGECQKNGSCTGSLGDIVAQRADVAFNMRYTYDAEDFVEVIYPLYERKLSLVVPAGKMRPESLRFVSAFSGNLWLLLVINFIIACIIFHLLQRWATNLIASNGSVNDDVTCRLRGYAVIELIFKAQFGIPIRNFTHTNCLRLFVVSWILSNYVMTNIYFAKLESNFVRQTYERDYAKVADFEHVNMPIFLDKGLCHFLNGSLDKKFRWILKRTHIVPQNTSIYPYALKTVKNTTNVAFILRRESARDFLAKTYNTKLGRPRFHSIPQYIFSMPRSYVVQLGSPYRYKIECLKKRLFENGMLEYALKDVTHRHQNNKESQKFYESLGHNLGEIKSGNRNDMDDLHKSITLSVEILQGAFYLWSFGVVFGLLTFAVEHMMHHRA